MYFYMCIMLSDHEPNSTRLINIPVVYNNYRYKLLIYTNDLAVENDSNNNYNSNSWEYDNSFSKQTSFSRAMDLVSISNGQNSNNGKGALMIVPIPNTYNTDSFGLVDVSTLSMKAMRKELFRECQKLVPRSRGLLLSNNSYGFDGRMANSKKVHTVGNYSISVADNLNELENNIDWSKFDKPRDFDSRFNTLKNKKLYPENNYAYVVAQAQNSVKDDGFGIVYPDGGYDYFPTAHEELVKNNSQILNYSSTGQFATFGNQQTYSIPSGVAYDVKIYNFSDSNRNGIGFSGKKRTSYNLTNKSIINSLLKQLNRKMTMSDTGETKEFYVNSEASLCNYLELDGLMENENLIISK